MGAVGITQLGMVQSQAQPEVGFEEAPVWHIVIMKQAEMGLQVREQLVQVRVNLQRMVTVGEAA